MLEECKEFIHEVKSRVDDHRLARGAVSDRDANGRALRMLGVQIDINDLKLAQDRRTRSKDAAE